MRQVLGAGALGRPRGMEWGGMREGGSGWGTHVNPRLIHVSVWQKPLQYCNCKVISLKLIKINEKKKKESSPVPQFKSISSLALGFLHGPALTSIRDYWKNHSFDHTHLLLAKWYLCFLIHCPGLSLLSFQGANIF